MQDAYAQGKITFSELTGSFCFHEFIPRIWEGGNSRPLERLCQLARKMGARYLVEEKLAKNEELEAEHACLKRRCGDHVTLEASRYTFIAQRPKKGEGHRFSEWVIAYFVLIDLDFEQEYKHFKKSTKKAEDLWVSPAPKPMSYMYEAVMRFPTKYTLRPDAEGSLQVVPEVPVCNHYYHGGKTFVTVVGDEEDHFDIKIPGLYFTQQNDLTSVCAHVALQMAINNSPLYRGGKLTSIQINDILGITHEDCDTRIGHYSLDKVRGGTRRSGPGLSTKELIEVVKKLGLDVLTADFVDQPNVDCTRWVYPYLESSFPTILGIRRAQDRREEELFRHVLPIVGHTRNTDGWSPEARSGYGELEASPHHSAHEWVDQLIVCDDNFGVHSTIPTETLRNVLLPRYNGNIHPSVAFAIVPKGVTARGMDMELIASLVFSFLVHYLRKQQSGNKWIGFLSESDKLVYRTMSVTRQEYIRHLNAHADSENIQLRSDVKEYLRRRLTRRVWLTEVSIPSLFLGRNVKLGDILTRTDVSYANYGGTQAERQRFFKTVQFCWLPGLTVSRVQVKSLKILPPIFEGYYPIMTSPHAIFSSPEW